MKKPTKEIHCSVVVTVHSEGRLLHRTLRALHQSMVYAKLKGGYDLETIIVMDTVTDQETKDVIFTWKDRLGPEFSLYKVKYKSLSLSRNFGIEKATGTYISILDGDDLYSENWLAKSIKALEADRFDIAHPQIIVGFPIDPFQKELRVENDCHKKLFETNLWPALTMAAKTIFVNVPYEKNEGQYSYEDWLWNCQTIFMGYRHGCVENTLMAIRQKSPDKSLWQKSYSQNMVVRPNLLFKSLIEDRNNKEDMRAKECKIYDKIMRLLFDYINFKSPSLYEFIKNIKRKIVKSDNTKVAKWIKYELENLELIEPELTYSQTFRKIHDNPILSSLTDNIAHFSRILTEEKEEVIFIGNVQDRHIYTEYSNPKGKLAIITEEKNCNTASLDIDYICLSDINVNTDRLTYLILRVLMESNVEKIILANSTLGNELYMKYHSVLNIKHAYICFLMSDEYKDKGPIFNRKIIAPLSSCAIFEKIYVDSLDFAIKLSEIYGISKDAFVINGHRHP